MKDLTSQIMRNLAGLRKNVMAALPQHLEWISVSPLSKGIYGDSSCGAQIAPENRVMLDRVLIALTLAGTLAAASSENAAEIVRRSVSRTEANWQAAPNYSFFRTTSKSKPGPSVSIETQQVLMINGSPYLKVIAQGGQPLSTARANEEEVKLRRETDHRSKESQRDRSQRLRKYAEHRTRDHNLLTAMSEAFDYTFADQQQPAAAGVWVMEGRPKPGYVPANRDAKVLSSMKVKLWIDKATYQWVCLEAEVMQPVSLYGMLAKVSPGTRFKLEQEPVSPKVWMPKHFTMQVNASALGLIHEDFTEDDVYSNYSLAPATTIEAEDLSQRPLPVQ